ncbi:ABC-F family ATP-binding cassette domain-containing protein [Sulfurimonas sp.]|uniref:ABC-F family ATP-binding cassette domain-containing protein n=1 Tax=Sulfurimonas sp. TaxID=2022749 RepID=UPI0025E30280|nr:ABC-F family ATP-binding cassette domain-containing protein [Sulfurimonas sp.]MCK9472802.1 ABC-F family ATP-binding cassette domain-containing protein [Sulfurimonas sp.]MDD3506077.1 ABC-F family ATP-binding cassette domain-containing protein [Sulfurimonas sp.]
MALIDLLNISKHYEAQKILIDVNFHIEEGERIVIIGKNGSGKSTLMKIINKTLEQDSGERIIRQNLEVKMLDQKPDFQEGHTVREAVEAGLKELNEAKQKYNELSLKLADDFENRKLIDEHERLSSYIEHHNAWNLDDKVERIIQHFDLKQYENKLVVMLSGGEQRRVALASLLLQKPDVLLLDEPTNHLDVYMVEFLEELLLKEKFTLVFISHDRYFIDRVATKSVEVEDCSLREYSGGYSDYLAQKEEYMRTLEKQHENLLDLLKRENEWFSRGVKARLKRNEGRKERLLALREDAKTNPSKIKKMTLELEREAKHFNRDKSVNKQKMLFEVENLGLRLGDKELLKDFNTRILQKDVIAIVGPNGSGKSTLLKALLGRIEPTSGVIKRGEFKIGYFDQHREMLDDEKNLLETFCPHGGDRVSVRGRDMHVYGYLKNFLFPREFLDKKIGILSGGEKNRIALALLFTKNVDILILDEPTNDLDIPTINILEEQLINFSGAVIIVSHDRYFVDKIAKKLFIFKEDKRIEESYQSYTEYLELEKELKELSEMDKESKKIELKPKQSKPKEQKLTFKEKIALEKLPLEIDELEVKMDEKNSCLANPVCYETVGIAQLARELEELRNLYEQKVEELLSIQEKEEEINNS